MTCIIAVERGDGTAIVGTDSALTAGDRIDIVDRAKWHQSGCVRMLFAGSLRVPQILANDLQFPSKVPDDITGMLHDSVPIIRKTLEAGGALTKDEDGDYQSSEIIFVCGGTVHVMYSDFAIYRPRRRYIACGSGSDIALGALYAMSPRTRMTPRGVSLALAASAEYNTSVAPPFYVAVI